MRNDPIKVWPNAIQFETYGKAEIERLSVKEIIEPNLFYHDKDGEDKTPELGGLYDPAMGPMNRGETCVTCNRIELHCPGHCGHINLATPCINPIFYGMLKNLIIATCIDCNHFLCTEKTILVLRAKLLCLNAGRLDLFNEIENETKDNYGAEKDDIGEDSATLGTKSKTLDALRDFIQAKTEELDLDSATEMKVVDRTIVLLKRQTVDRFFDIFSRKKRKKCPKCHKQQDEIKFEAQGETKVYLEVFSKNKESIDLDNVNTDEEDEGDDIDILKKDVDSKCLQRIPSRLLLRRIKKIFQVEKGTTDLLFNGAQTELFFIELVLVSPNCFRRLNRAGRKVITADRTTQLKNILETSQKLRWLLGYRSDQVNVILDEGYESQTNELKAKSFLHSIQGATLDEKQETLENQLQQHVNLLIDSNMEKNVNSKMPGAKQRLEKKTGLFRQNIMGKRVNFCARTVITPDPNIATNEFGVSDFVAKKLTYPERVTQYNYKELQDAVINGPDIHPGATAIIHPNGRKEALSADRKDQRIACANQLLTTDRPDEQGLIRMKTVLRHLRTGDSILANRQPTLHKGSIMAHRARVIHGEKTFRLHYSNCKHFNADFDGDEMNVHFPQSEEARAEAETLMNSDQMFRSAKDGFPLAGLMQDHVIAGTTMTVRGAFYEKTDYQNLVVNGLERFCGGKRIKFLPPAIFKPKALWTGKQIITTIIQNLCNGSGPNFVGNCKMKDTEYIPPGVNPREWNKSRVIGCSLSESELICRNGYLVSGYLDKSQVGASKYSILAAIEELFGGTTAGSVISSITHLLTHYLKCYRGFTLGIRDVVTKPTILSQRNKIVKKAELQGLSDLAVHFKLCEGKLPKDISNLDKLVREKLREAHLIGRNVVMDEVDAVSKKSSNTLTEQIHRLCEKNLEIHFPDNNLEMLIATGAKGSKANLLNMCSNLGQVEFDGKRPPLMASGRTLPCFKPYEHKIRAGAFISNRYCSGGLRPQEMFFHVMAGRDGLIDTACKTASSGYLQRCLIKHLEGITISYDRTVRDHDQSVLQFQYGGDGVDVSKTPYLAAHQFPFIQENYNIYKKKLWANRKIPAISNDVMQLQKQKEKYMKRADKDGWTESNVGGIDRVLAFNDFLKKHEKLSEFLRHVKGKLKEGGRELMDQYNEMAVNSWHQVRLKERNGKIKKYLDPPLEKMQKIFEDEYPLNEEVRKKWIDKRYLPDPHISLLNPDRHLGSASEYFSLEVKKYINSIPQNDLPLTELLYSKYQQSLMDPGDQIGLVIAQSIGEPSTQMTLNTFHMAGKADVNITLGIPRLRELLMTAPLSVKTPSMTIPFHRHVTDVQADEFCKTLKKVKLSDVITKITGENKLVVNGPMFWLQSIVDIHIGSKLCENFGLEPKHVLLEVIRKKLFDIIKKKHEKFTKDKKAHQPNILQQADKNDSVPSSKRSKCSNTEDGNEDDIPEVQDDDDKDDIEYEDIDIESDGDNIPGNEEAEVNSEDNEDSVNRRSTGKNSELDIWSEVVTKFKDIASISHDVVTHKWVHIVYNRRSEAEKVDLVHVIAEAVREISIQGIKDIGKVTWKQTDAGNCELITEGINFDSFLNYPSMLNLNCLSTNDVNAFRERYGIEAAVMTIQREIDNVFRPYGIEINKRHTSMLADYMTQEGKYRPFSRHGLKSCASPFQKMTYETTTQFLVDSIVYGEKDDLSSPSARIATGQLFNGGTGYFDLQQQIIF